MPYALATGAFIAAYSVVDGMGVRLSATPIAYTAWMGAMWGLLMPAVYVLLRDARSLWQPPYAGHAHHRITLPGFNSEMLADQTGSVRLTGENNDV